MATQNTPGQAAATASMVGQHLGSYKIETLLGRGGMAAVYRALDTNLQRRVAVKVLDPAVAAQPGFRDRFRQEAQLIAGLRHPNIVQVYDLGEYQGTPYMVQELLPGPTLEQRLHESAARGVRLPPAEVLTIVQQLAAALDAAHAAGVIHRDVKPANAMWNASGALVLTDFGIAKQLQGSVTQTQAGTIFGTPHYLSPEQAQGLPLSPASDVYALGVVLYELLAGRPPFDGTTPISVAVNHVHTPPPPLAAQVPGLPPDVEAVVQQALAKQPDARFRSAGALARALGQAWSGLQPAAAAAVHNQPTQVWPVAPAAFGPTIAQAAPPPAGPPAPTPAPAARIAARAAAPPAPVATRPTTTIGRRGGLLPILGGALLLLLLAGIALAARGSDERVVAPTEVPATGQATAVASQPTEAPPLPTEVPPQPTAPPAPTEPGPPAPTEAPAAAADPIEQLRALFAASAGNGGDTDAVRKLEEKLDKVVQELNEGDAQEAASKLSELQRELLEGAAKGRLDPALVQQGLLGVDAIAEAHELPLALQVEPDND